MGIFYFVHSVALAEDLPMSETEALTSIDEFYNDADKQYLQVHRLTLFLYCYLGKSYFRMPTIVG